MYAWLFGLLMLFPGIDLPRIGPNDGGSRVAPSGARMMDGGIIPPRRSAEVRALDGGIIPPPRRRL